MKITPLGDAAALVTLADNLDPGVVAAGQALADALERDPIPGYLECVPANASVTVFYDPVRLVGKDGGSPWKRVVRWIEARAAASSAPVREVVERRVLIPVCYGGDEGPDLETVAAVHGLAAAEVAERHCAADYYVSAIGFTPGFPYLAGLPEGLHTPRRTSPRTVVPAGSVAIGGGHTGIYPQGTPGGWHLIGRTPLRLFNPQARPPALLQVGDRVRFRPITVVEFRAASSSP